MHFYYYIKFLTPDYPAMHLSSEIRRTIFPMNKQYEIYFSEK